MNTSSSIKDSINNYYLEHNRGFCEIFDYEEHHDVEERIGIMYCLGEGTSMDKKKALYWFKKAAKRGNADAMLRIGEIYYVGIGVPQDYKKAFKWYSRADEETKYGYEALYLLGSMYRDGKGVDQNNEKASEYFSSLRCDNHF